MSGPVNVGFLLPQFGELARRDTLHHFAALAEDLGYESIWAADHIITPRGITSPYPYNQAHTYLPPELEILEPFVALGFLASCTTTVKLGFSVLILGYRHPVETAKMIATLDVLSEGRILVGAGVGWLREEFEALDQPFANRGRRGDEIIEIWKQLWTQDTVSYDGEFYKLKELVCRPQPVQKPHPPITIGGHSEAAYRRMLRHGATGFQVVLDTADTSYGVHGTLQQDIELLKRLADEAGRDWSTIEITGVFITTTAEQMLREVDRYQELGMSRFVMDFVISGTPGEMEDILQTVAKGLGTLRVAS